jgi:hypothetical protein
MAELPTPLKAFVGLVAAAADRLPPARELPEKALELPVLAVSMALQASLRMQQVYAELSARGDDVLGQLRGAPEHPPAWAQFDEPDDADGPEGPDESDDSALDAHADADPPGGSAGAPDVDGGEPAMDAVQDTKTVHTEWRDDDADLTDDETQIPVDDRYADVADAHETIAVAPAIDPAEVNPAGADHAAEYQAPRHPGSDGRAPSPFDLAE